jgi:hypothetical protein
MRENDRGFGIMERPWGHAPAVLLHPATLIALALLLLNDHLLRRVWPSALTGKLGDVAWLFFAPVVLAVLIELPWPRRLLRERGLAGPLGFCLVGGIFALTKTVPSCHAAVVAAASTLFGFAVGWRRDPTDLIALSVLAPAWLLWRRAPPCSRPNRRACGLVIAAAALLTMANAPDYPPPRYGYYCAWAADGKLLVSGSYTTTISTDGGITWQQYTQSPPVFCPSSTGAQDDERVLIDPSRAGVRYRYTPGGEIIERSVDAGLTWQADFRLAPKYEAAAARKDVGGYGNIMRIPLPVTAVVEPRTGTVVFAMGWRGILVRKADGQYTWVSDGEGETANYGFSGAEIPALLMGESMLAVELLLLSLCTLGSRVSATLAAKIFLVLAWLLWGLAVFGTPPALSNPFLMLAAIAAAALVVLPLAAYTLFRVASVRPRALPRILLASTGAALLFLLPYLLWALNAVPRYTLAVALAVALVAAALYAGARWVDLASS